MTLYMGIIGCGTHAGHHTNHYGNDFATYGVWDPSPDAMERINANDVLKLNEIRDTVAAHREKMARNMVAVRRQGDGDIWVPLKDLRFTDRVLSRVECHATAGDGTNFPLAPFLNVVNW